MSTTIVEDLQRATTAINNIQSAIESKTSERLNHVPVEQYDDSIRSIPSLKINEGLSLDLAFNTTIKVDDDTAFEILNYCSDLSNLCNGIVINNTHMLGDKTITLRINLTDRRTNHDRFDGSVLNLNKAFYNLQSNEVVIMLYNLFSGVLAQNAFFSDVNMESMFENAGSKLPLDDCDSKIKIKSKTSTNDIITSNVSSMFRNARGICGGVNASENDLDLRFIHIQGSVYGNASVGNMMNGFIAPETSVYCPNMRELDASVDVTGSSEYANMNVLALNGVNLGYKNSLQEMYDDVMPRNGHAFYNSTINRSLVIVAVPGQLHYASNTVPVSQISSFLDLADVWDAVDFTELATAYSNLLKLGTDYQEGSTFEPGNVVVYKYNDQQLSGDESAITDLGVTIVDIPRA